MARALARAVALALAVPMPALAQAVTEGWQISGTNVLRAERYDAGGDSVDKRYTKAGTYRVRLRVTDSAKRTSTTSTTVSSRSSVNFFTNAVPSLAVTFQSIARISSPG